MKIDLGIHIVMHLVFFGKTGVTTSPLPPPTVDNRELERGEYGAASSGSDADLSISTCRRPSISLQRRGGLI
jgi:hypothetical protein